MTGLPRIQVSIDHLWASLGISTGKGNGWAPQEQKIVLLGGHLCCTWHECTTFKNLRILTTRTNLWHMLSEGQHVLLITVLAVVVDTASHVTEVHSLSPFLVMLCLEVWWWNIFLKGFLDFESLKMFGNECTFTLHSTHVRPESFRVLCSFLHFYNSSSLAVHCVGVQEYSTL